MGIGEHGMERNVIIVGVMALITWIGIIGYQMMSGSEANSKALNGGSEQTEGELN